MNETLSREVAADLEKLIDEFDPPDLAPDEFTIRMVAEQKAKSYYVAERIVKKMLNEKRIELVGMRRASGKFARAYRIVKEKRK